MKVDKLVYKAEDSHRKLLARNEEVGNEVVQLVRGAIQEQGTSSLSGIAPETPIVRNLSTDPHSLKSVRIY